MIKYLIDPKLKWYKANLHCHTNKSDGHFTPEEMKQVYLEHGYNIVAFTDHELIFDSSYLTDKNFVAITATEFSITETGKPANHDYGRRNSDGTVSWLDMETVHLNLYSKDPHNTFHPATSKEIFEARKDKLGSIVPECDGYHREFTHKSIQETIKRANKAGFLVQFNHPNWSLNTRKDYMSLKGLWGLEIYNYLTELETGTEYCINIYDDMLRSGHKLFCTMGDDNHNWDGSLDGSFGGFNYIGVDKLTYENVISAMEKGDIYASSGPIIKSLYIDTEDGKIYVECSEAEDIIFTGYGRTFRHYHGENLTKADFKIFGGEVYFRITVRNKYGKVAHTHAYFLKDYGYEEI